MGILENNRHRDVAEDRTRRRVLRANIQALSERRGLGYHEAVKLMAQRIERSPATVYSWLVERDDGSNGARPMPVAHYNRMIDAGVLDPALNGDPAAA